MVDIKIDDKAYKALDQDQTDGVSSVISSCMMW